MPPSKAEQSGVRETSTQQPTNQSTEPGFIFDVDKLAFEKGPVARADVEVGLLAQAFRLLAEKPKTPTT